MQTLRVSWCVNISDVSVNQLALHCPLLQTLEVSRSVTHADDVLALALALVDCLSFRCVVWPKSPTRVSAAWHSDASTSHAAAPSPVALPL
jgi:hypothetical protein